MMTTATVWPDGETQAIAGRVRYVAESGTPALGLHDSDGRDWLVYGAHPVLGRQIESIGAQVGDLVAVRRFVVVGRYESYCLRASTR